MQSIELMEEQVVKLDNAINHLFELLSVTKKYAVAQSLLKAIIDLLKMKSIISPGIPEKAFINQFHAINSFKKKGWILNTEEKKSLFLYFNDLDNHEETERLQMMTEVHVLKVILSSFSIINIDGEGETKRIIQIVTDKDYQQKDN